MDRKKHVYLSDLHFDHQLWINELSFFRDETGIYEKRLATLVRNWTDHDVLSQLEQFQNQFIRQREVIDILEHEVKLHEEKLARYAKDHTIAIDHVYFTDHDELKGQMERFRAIYQELKDKFYAFMAKYL